MLLISSLQNNPLTDSGGRQGQTLLRRLVYKECLVINACYSNLANNTQRKRHMMEKATISALHFLKQLEDFTFKNLVIQLPLQFTVCLSKVICEPGLPRWVFFQ